MSNPQKVYNAIKLIPIGKISTYGSIAQYIGAPKASRMVGKVLHNNPDPTTIKCHRVVYKDGSLSQSFAFGGISKQAELLKNQGVDIDMKAYKVINMEKYLVNFKENM